MILQLTPDEKIAIIEHALKLQLTQYCKNESMALYMAFRRALKCIKKDINPNSFDTSFFYHIIDIFPEMMEASNFFTFSYYEMDTEDNSDIYESCKGFISTDEARCLTLIAMLSYYID